MIDFLFRRKQNAGHATPQHQGCTVPVNVTATTCEVSVEGLPWKPEPQLAAQIRAELPNATPISTNLRAARAATVLRQEAAFLADTSGNVPPPEREALIDALASRPTTSLTGW